MYQLAKDTPSYVPQGISHEQMPARIVEAVRGNSIPLADIKDGSLAHAVDAV